MSFKEPYIALTCAALWIIGGAIYFWMTSKSKGKEIMLTSKPQTA